MKIAFIGAGNMASLHAQAFADISGVELAGVTSRTLKKAKKFNLPVTADTIEDLYKKTKADLVIIAVSIAQTASVLKTALEFPWKIIVEKPLGPDYSTAQNLTKLIEQTDRKNDVFLALNRRFLSSTLQACEILKKDRTKRIIKIQDRQSIGEAMAYGHPKEVAENFMYSNSIHLIDYFYIFAQSPISTVNTYIKEENYILSELKYENGDLGIYEGFWEVPGPWGVDITCRARRYELKPLEQLNWQELGSHKKYPAEISKWDKVFKPGLRAQAEEAVKMLKKQKHKLPTTQEAFKTVELIKSIYGY